MWFYRIILQDIHIHLRRSTSALKIVPVGYYASLPTLIWLPKTLPKHFNRPFSVWLEAPPLVVTSSLTVLPRIWLHLFSYRSLAPLLLVACAPLAVPSHLLVLGVCRLLLCPSYPVILPFLWLLLVFVVVGIWVTRMLGASKLTTKAYFLGKRGDELETAGDRYCTHSRAMRFCLRAHTGLELAGKIRVFVDMHHIHSLFSTS
jgi:hypothetical protein